MRSSTLSFCTKWCHRAANACRLAVASSIHAMTSWVALASLASSGSGPTRLGKANHPNQVTVRCEAEDVIQPTMGMTMSSP